VEAHYGPCSRHWPRRNGFLVPAGDAGSPFTLEALQELEGRARLIAGSCNDEAEGCSLHVRVGRLPTLNPTP